MSSSEPPSVQHESGELLALRPSFPIAAIGGGAGAVDPLLAILGRLQSNQVAVFVLQQQPGTAEELVDLVRRQVTREVVVAEHAQKVRPGVIYVVRSGQAPAFADGQLVLTNGDAQPESPRPVLDLFFRSLALTHGTGAIAVMLSGAGMDGTLGLQEVKAAGGITMVQDPATASFPEMPQTALQSGFADFALAPADIGEELTRICSHWYVAPERASPPDNKEVVPRILQMLRGSFKLDFTHYKMATLERRIERRMALQRLDRIDDYLKLLQGNPSELSQLYKDLLINVTSFFRDREPFDRLKQDVLPRILEGRPTGAPLRVWVPGCATGEEAYSIAMCMLELLGDRVADYRVQIFSTDVDEDALGAARMGVFPQNIDLDVSPDRLARFFTRRDRHYQISKQIRDMVIFAGHNLTRDPPFSRIDLVSCRNVLIYMQASLQKKVLRIFHYALNPNGWLLLGNSETVGEVSGLFTLVDRKVKLYLKRNIAAAAVFDLHTEPPADEPPVTHTLAPAPAPDPHARPTRVTVQQLADRKVLERYGPPGVLVNENLEVLQFRGKTGRYLEPATGSATLNLLKLARPELVIELRNALTRVFSGGVGLTTPPIRLRDGDGNHDVRVEVIPVADPGAQTQCALVLFDADGDHPPRTVPAARRGDGEEKADDLERELGSTKEYLQSVIAELETTNEELQSSNEELQSANEELQSTNEELQTSKEELQSANEELATVNEELQNRMTELGQFKDDLHNIIEGLQAAVLLVNMDVRVRYISPAATAILGLAGGEVGRPLGHLFAKSEGASLERLVWDVIQTLRPREQALTPASGREYRLRVTPYRSSAHTIKGAVVSFLPPESGGAAPAEEGKGV